MAFDSVIKEEAPQPEPPAPAPVDPRIEAQLLEMRAQINQAYQQSKGIQAPQVQYVPYPVAQQAPEPQLSEAEFLADLPGSVQAIAARIAAQREAELREELGLHLGALYTKDFERDKRDLASNPYHKYVAEELEAHFNANPNERLQPGRLKQKFDELVGSKIGAIQAEQATVGGQVERVRAVDVSLPISSSAVPSSRPRKAVELDPVREEMRQSFERQMRDIGFKMSPEEWVAVESGRALGGTKWVDDVRPLPPLPETE